MTVLQDHKSQLEREKTAADEARAFYLFFRKFPGDDSKANELMYRKALGQKEVNGSWEGGDDVTLENLEQVRPLLIQGVQYGDTLLQIFPASDVQVEERTDREKKGLIQALTDRLKGSMSADMLAAEQKRWQYMNTTELQVKLDEAARRAQMKGLTPARLREVIRGERPSTLPKLPDEITPEVIRKADTATLRKWNRLYGQQQINDRLGVVPRSQVGTVWSR